MFSKFGIHFRPCVDNINQTPGDFRFAMSASSTKPACIPAVPGWGLRLRKVLMLLSTFAVAMSMSNSAVASCGNYLFRNGKPVSHQTMAGPSELSLRVPQSGSDQLPHTLIGRSDATPLEVPVGPCNGPNCSRSRMPLAPVPAAPTNLIRNVDQAALLETLSQASQGSGEVEFPESERGACYEPSSIFRPPAA
jgi:hypothetical protein